MERKFNFSAGPAVLPEPVVRQAQEDLWSHQGSGLGIAEISHRGAQFDAVIESAKARLRRLLGLTEDQHVLFLQGGARTQFYQWPMNVLRGGTAAYLNTGRWADLAAKDARRFGEVVEPFTSKDDGWNRVPAAGEVSVPEGAVYLHYTSNNTVAGGEFQHVPDPGDAMLVCDMSSNFLSRPVDGSAFDFIYAGAQKNVGPSGVTLVIVKQGALERMTDDLPEMLRYGKQVEKDSMLNTPCTFGIYVIDLVCRWLEEDMGGLAGIEAHNIAQADKIYGVIDGSDFWQGKVEPASRSRMNLTFTTGDADRDTRFHKAAAAADMSGLKGHRSVGGLRASLYNAQTDAAVDALVDFMREFERTEG